MGSTWFARTFAAATGFASLAVLGLLVGGCSDPEGSGCTSGATQECLCVGGGNGVQACGADGAWGDCEGCGDGCTDADGDGFFSEADCETAVDCNDADAAINPSASEVCDDVDNDCDGETDPGCACAEAETMVCGGHPDAGECVNGTQTCETGAWGPCVGAVGPTTETCDGLDNDCDGDTDEEVAGTGLPCLIDGQAGVCAVGEVQCRGGEMTCEQAHVATDEVCNFEDDDCDGAVDEGNPSGGAECTVPGVSGPCAAGELQCRSGVLSCIQTVFPRDETCDGTDENCNGIPDDRPVDEEPCVCVDDHTVDCGTEVGECSMGEQVCVEGGYGECGGEGYLPAVPETCDGLDNDCDGTPDNGNPEGGEDCTVTGELGPCAEGVLNCEAGDLVCSQVVEPTDERCNGVDDDCDGTADDGNPGGGAGCLVPGADGPCRFGVLLCRRDLGELICDQTVEPLLETGARACNGIDDDCDGSVDEDGACDCRPGTRRTCGDTDVGECEYGTQLCDESGAWPEECPGAVGPVEETCNWRDDDCNGHLDDIEPTRCDTGRDGICADGTQICDRLGRPICTGPAPTREECNDLDDDCDGTADEDGSWPAADSYEFNQNQITSARLGTAPAAFDRVNSPTDPVSFHAADDADFFTWSFPVSFSLTGIPLNWMCRVTGLEPDQRVRVWVGADSAWGPPFDVGETYMIGIRNEGVVMHSFTIPLGDIRTPPFTFTVGVIPHEGFGPCFSTYDVECKLSTTPRW